MTKQFKRVCLNCRSQSKVPGYGNMDHPAIAFIGESPGMTEVNEGRAFSPNGKSGELLHRIVTDLGVDPKTLYYDNVTMCPSHGKPSAAKAHECYDGLMDLLAFIKPKLIVPMGNVAAKQIGQYEKGITFVRGSYRELDLDGHRVGVLPTFHPAAILRDPDLFRDLEADLRRAIAVGVDGEPAIIPTPYENYVKVKTQKQLEAVWPLLEGAKKLAVDLETSSRMVYEDEILIIGMAYKPEHAATFDWALFEPDPETKQSKQNLKRLAVLLKEKKCIFQTAGFDIAWLWSRGIYPNLWFDTEVAHWLLDERERGHGLESMAMAYLKAPPWKAQFRKRNGLGAYIKSEEQFGAKFSSIPQDDMMLYNAADADYTYRLAKVFRPQVKEQGMMEVMHLIMDATKLYTELFLTGVNIDMDNLDALEAEYTQKAQEALKVLVDLAPDVNPRSPQQLAKYFYDELELEPFGGGVADGKEVPMGVLSANMEEVGKTDLEAAAYWKSTRPQLFGSEAAGGRSTALSNRSTGAFTLYWLRQQHDYPKYLIQYKTAQKRLSTYVANIRKNIWPDGKIHPDYRLVGHLHGRFRSSRPGMHTLPNEDNLYNVFCAPPGYVIIHADYKQADLRMIAHLSGDKKLAEWLKGDPHSEVVKVIWRLNDKQLAEMKRDYPEDARRARLAAKAVNFGLMYGRGANSLAPQLGVTPQEAKLYVERYWAGLPVTKRWIDSRYATLIKGDQEYVGPFGNKRRFPLIVSAKHRQHLGMLGANFPIMSSVNYLTTLSHLAIVKNLRETGIKTLVYMHVHDSMNVAVPIKHLKRAAQIVSDTMSRVPIEAGFGEGITWPVDVDAGTHWGSLKVVEGLVDWKPEESV